MAKSPTEIIATYNRLKSDRCNWETQWQEIADFMLPRKNDIIKKHSPGQKKHDEILDNTGMLSLELLAGALHGLLTSPNQEWFELTTGIQDLDDDDEVRDWLQSTAKRILLTLNNSNFQTEVHELYLDLAGFSTAPMSIEEDDTKVVRFSSKPIQNVVVDENHLGVIDCIYMSLEWDIRKIMGLLGPESLSESMKTYLQGTSSMGKGDADKKWQLIYAIYPSGDAKYGEEKNGQKNKITNQKYTSQWVSVSDKMDLKLGGFNEFPWVVPRWSKVSGEIYGRGPGMTALPEVKMVQKMQETIIKGAQKVVDPPLQAPHDGFLLPLNTKPGGINIKLAGTNANDNIVPILNDSRIDFGQQVMEDVRNRIKAAFYVDQLQLGNGPQMTATEVLQRTEEKMRLLGPLLGRQSSEFLSPLIERVYKIMERRGLLDQVPEKLVDREIRVQYSSMIAKAQRVNESNSVMRFVQAAAPFIHLDPTAAEVLNSEEAVRSLARTFGLPSSMIRKKKDIEEVRNARAEAETQVADIEEQRRRAEIDRTRAQGAASNAQAQAMLQQ